MQGRISNIVPLVLITIISVISVEGAYQALEFFVLKPSIVSQKNRTQEPQKTTDLKESQGERPDYRMILKRNLFGTTLKNSTLETQASSLETTAKNANDLGIVLMGTVSGSDSNNRAIILTKQTRDQELFSAGEVIEGAIIKEIQRGKLVLTINGKDEVLDMSEAAKMRPVFKAPPSSSANKSARLITPDNGDNPASLNAAPTPRRRIIRRPRATQNSQRTVPQQRRLPVKTQP